ncbi:MAG: FAD-dependent oxidoreductase, partial [Actinobacteria bacterium]|nr:FAD-dependent oxidoreductase [Actinomycetota bacterium]
MSIDDNPIDQRHLDAIADAEHVPFWLDGAHSPDTNPTLVRTESCDLCVIGGGYTGLWTAIIAKERDASRDIVLIDSAAVGSAASGRNGGFMDASLTHGISNAFRHFPDDVEVLEELGMRNLDDIELALQRYGIECDYHRNGVIEVVA